MSLARGAEEAFGHPALLQGPSDVPSSRGPQGTSDSPPLTLPLRFTEGR